MMGNFLAKTGLGIVFCILLFLPIMTLAVIFSLSGACIWGMLILIILFTSSLSDDSTLALMDSFSENSQASEETIKQCLFCGENHDDEDCYYMGLDDLTGGGIL